MTAARVTTLPRRTPKKQTLELSMWAPITSERAIKARAAQAAIVMRNLPRWCPEGAPDVAAALGLVNA